MEKPIYHKIEHMVQVTLANVSSIRVALAQIRLQWEPVKSAPASHLILETVEIIEDALKSMVEVPTELLTNMKRQAEQEDGG